MPRAVKFDRYGDVEVLHVASVREPSPSAGEVVVRVRSAGVSTGEAKIRSGAMDAMAPAHFPEGQGTELSGVVHAVGPDVRGLSVGDEVIGWSDVRGAQADYAVLPQTNTVARPLGLDWDTAAVSVSSGATATSAIQAVAPYAGETVVVAGAAGGTGVVAVQLAVQKGARVVATASEHNHEFLRRLGAAPVAYGEGLEERILALSPDGVDAFADCHGEGNVDLAVRLGVEPNRINTIADFEAAARVGARTQGMYQLDDLAAVIGPFAETLARGLVVLPIKGRFALSEVQDAYRRLTRPGGVGRVVIVVSTDDE